MNSPARRFNIILVLLFFVCAGCETTEKSDKSSKPEKKEEKDKEKSKQAAIIRFHAESNPDATGRTIEVSVFRSQPMLITIQRDAVLDEGYLRKAEIVDVDELGGYAIKLTFNDQGARRLEALTIEHRGQHVAINGTWTESRWLAAPLLSKRISNGEFVFTPDATREESERIVNGLQNVIKKLTEKYTF